MEHSTLHAIQLIGLLLAVGGPLLVLALLRPACRSLGPEPERTRFAHALENNIARWSAYGACAAALATLADFFVQAAELQGITVLGGVNLSLVSRFVAETAVGRLNLARTAVLALAALAIFSPARWRWRIVLALATASAVFTSLVSHAAAQPIGRAGAILTQLLHVCAGGAWLGVLMHLLAARKLIREAVGPGCAALTAEVVRRFSPVAMLAVFMLFCSGLAAVYRFVREPQALVTSAYGLTLLLKLSLLGLVLYAGYQNYAAIRPALIVAAHSGDPKSTTRTSGDDVARRRTLGKLTRMLELEVTAGLLVITVAGILGSVSPPGQPGTQRLTTAQTEALMRPHWPTTRVVNPNEFYGAPDRTFSDLRYSEFMHNCSGIAVCLLGLCWLVQSLSDKPGAYASRIWPAMLVLFGLFIAAASDPEVWLLRRVSLGQALADPQLLEHQLGAVMVFLIAWLAWRNRKQAGPARLLGYALPGIMVFGSLLLLGHAHSTLTAPEELTNLINVQHAVFGTFGLLAGTLRWLGLRALIPPRLAAWCWPGLVIGLGLFMTFCYREVV